MTRVNAAVFLCAVLCCVLLTGCDSTTAVVKDTYNQADKYLKDKTVLQRANVKLEEAKTSRAKLKDTADKLFIDAEVAVKQIERLTAETEKSKTAFVNLQDIAKKAGLPKKADAKPEDLSNKISVAGKEYTGEDVYRLLKDYKTELTKANAAVERQKKLSDMKRNLSNSIKSKMDKVDENIDAMEAQIENYKVAQEMVVAGKSVKDLGLDDDALKQLLNTDSIMSELTKKVDEANIGLEISDKETSASELKDALNSGDKKSSVTDDDLI